MTLPEAIDFIRPGIIPTSGTWADIGAGTGLFTQALMEILTDGNVIALDKSPHALYRIKPPPQIRFEIVDADFHQPLQLPPLDGILMANALHYAKDHLTVLKNVLASLRPGGTLILIEYETDIPNFPWVPNPIPFQQFKVLCGNAGLQDPVIFSTRDSVYQDVAMYAARTT